MEDHNLILSLPSELRLIIYEFAVIERVTGPRTCPSSGFTLSLVPPNLARVNRQLRQEVRPVYYRGNEFWLQLPTCQDRIRDSFFAQCMIAVDFLPLIRSLRCEVYLVPSWDWSIVFQTATSAPTSEGKDSEDWEYLSRSHDAYWSMLEDMLRNMTFQELCMYANSICRHNEVYTLAVSDALGFIAKQSLLGNHSIEAIFCSRKKD